MGLGAVEQNDALRVFDCKGIMRLVSNGRNGHRRTLLCRHVNSLRRNAESVGRCQHGALAAEGVGHVRHIVGGKELDYVYRAISAHRALVTAAKTLGNSSGIAKRLKGGACLHHAAPG